MQLTLLNFQPNIKNYEKRIGKGSVPAKAKILICRGN